MKSYVLFLTLAVALLSGCDNEEQMRLEQARQQAEAAAAALREDKQALQNNVSEYRDELSAQIEQLEQQAEALGGAVGAELQNLIADLRALGQRLQERAAAATEAPGETFATLSEEVRNAMQQGNQLLSQAESRIEEARQAQIAERERALEAQQERVAELEQRRQELEQRTRELQQMRQQAANLESELQQARQRAAELQQELREAQLPPER